MSQKEVQNEPCGVLIIDKPDGMTSHDIVGKVRRLYNTRRVGHTGTLDPMATGVLTVLIGRAAKAAEYLSADRKTYLATLRLGLTTDTEDTTGRILTQSEQIPDEAAVMAILSRFRGEIMQIPPMYSALKVNGQKLYDLARRGEVIERQARPITVYRLEAQRLNDTDYALTVTCSAGTYIRTLCADIGAALGCGGAMASLRRTEAGGFSLEQAYTPTALEEMTEEARTALLLPIDSLFADLPAVTLSAFHERLIRGGCAVDQRKLGQKRDLGTRVRLINAAGDFFALGEVVTDENEALCIKSIKTFVL
jgi:tRNA pseudouridine55 synthase